MKTTSHCSLSAAVPRSDWQPVASRMRPVEISVMAEAKRVCETAERVVCVAATVGLDEQDCMQLRMAFGEVLNNLIQHASCDDQGALVDIRILTARNALELAVTDRGKPMAMPPRREFPDPEVEGGRGWPIILSCVDSVEYVVASGVNILTLRKFLP